MKSIISSAVLSAALFSQVSMAATIGHGHGHAHRRAAAPEAAPKEKRFVNFMSVADVDLLDAKQIKVGKNIACTDKGSNPVTVGNTGGPFIIEFNNKGAEDLVVALWSGDSQWAAIDATFIGAHKADVTHTLQPNTTTWVSLNPDLVPSKALSGGFGAIHKDGGLSTVSGQLDDTWGEFTFTTASQFSTTDVSRLVNMEGNRMEIHNYASKEDAENETVDPACSSTMEKCSFVCDDKKLKSCMFGALVNCAVGTAGTTASASGQDGGCGGLSAEGGYVVVDFF